MDADALLAQYRRVRKTSEQLVEPLQPEDYRLQTMTEVSPPWWNLGHTTWFFAKVILEPRNCCPPESARLEYVLNSYYVALGPRLPRADRGKITRPTTSEIFRYRASVDERMEQLIQTVAEKDAPKLEKLVTIGLHHEQQHQELFLTEIKHIYFMNPVSLRTAYAANTAVAESRPMTPANFLPFTGGLIACGSPDAQWSWDNEKPAHQYYLNDFELQDRLVTCGEYREFMNDGGYDSPLLWLDNGWAAAREDRWTAPLYWERIDGEWMIWTLNGMQPLRLDEPVCHVSFYEADAYARWKAQSDAQYRNARLPAEREWEHALGVDATPGDGDNLVESRNWHPVPAANGADGLRQMFGDVWEWSADPYRPYPRYQPFQGALAEYNGKFMDGQYVLRGGSVATPRDHIRPTYRNFWAPDTRFQFSGIRLARDV